MFVIGHRGACGYRPEHTLASYALCIEQGADFVEPDLVATADGVLVCRNGNELSSTTDIADRAEYAERRASKTIDGRVVTGWFTEDFTLDEVKTLWAIERMPQLRPDNTAFDRTERIPTFDEVLELIRGRDVGVYPETKHPTYFRSVGLPLEEGMVGALHAAGYRSRTSRVYLQSFEVSNLVRLRDITALPIVQLLNDTGRPFDFAATGDGRTYADLSTPRGLASIARYADAIGPSKHLLIPRTADGALGAPTSLVDHAHAAGLDVHAFTFRRENDFLPTELRSSADPADVGDLATEIRIFADLGMDGFFTDNPDIGAAVAAERTP